jgi:REP element-mobilizing transposase RayT
MARQPRENVEGGLYHVYARGNGKQPIYLDLVDRQIYLGMLGQVVRAKQWCCLAYCLMNNHVHLLVETPEANLSSGMQRLHSGYARSFNARHDRVGHVFQGRYGAVRIVSDGQVCATAAYIARNPVESNLCERPEEWPWNSYRALRESTNHSWLDCRRLLRYFGEGREAALEQYARMAETGLVPKGL